MDIQDIKNSLDIIAVAEHLGIAVNPRTYRAICPFHDDKNPSLQFSREKQIATCFSSKCNAGTMDVISLTQKKLNLSTHETLNYLKQLIPTINPTTTKPQAMQEEKRNYHEDFEQMQSSLLNSSTAKEYLKTRAIDWQAIKGLPVGYNAFKNSKFSYLRGCVTFGLKDKNGKVVSMYGRSIRDNDKAKHYYTPNRQGLYPNYPNREAKRLILTESVIDAATLLSLKEDLEAEVLALYGTNGLTPEHVHAIQQLPDLEEIILFFDGDEAGREANKKHGQFLQELLPNITISTVETLEDEDVNSIAQGHESEIFLELINNRVERLDTQTKETSFSSSETKEQKVPPLEGFREDLNTTNTNNIRYTTETANYYIKGGIRKDLDSLKVTLVIESSGSTPKLKSRTKLDLYEDKQTEKVAREAGEKLNLRSDLIESDLNILTDLLDDYRESVVGQSEQEEEQKIIIPPSEKDKCIKFLKTPNLLQNINDLIGKSGVVGEENNRLFLFGIASSYKMNDTLHALIQGSSGSGKTHLLATIMDFMPPEDTISLTRVTESSFYNYGQYELQNKLIGMEDYDGLEEKAELAFRELQSKGMISSSTSGKDEHTGQITGYIKKVYGPIASLSATTQGEIYEDNMSRCFLVAVDESAEQTQRIIKYQNQRAAGKINKQKEKETQTFLRNCMRLLQPMEVINPYADKIDLPQEAHKIRRLNDLFQSYVKQITILNQYQRRRVAADNTTLITEKEDVQTAIEIMFDSIILKVDELDGSLRNFYEKLKSYVLQKGKDYEFTRLEIRQALKVSKTQQHSYMNQLIELEYLQQVGGYANRGFKYKIQYWDNNQKMRNDIRTYLNEQVKAL